jgi:hypothetical protein
LHCIIRCSRFSRPAVYFLHIALERTCKYGNIYIINPTRPIHSHPHHMHINSLQNRSQPEQNSRNHTPSLNTHRRRRTSRSLCPPRAGCSPFLTTTSTVSSTSLALGSAWCLSRRRSRCGAARPIGLGSIAVGSDLRLGSEAVRRVGAVVVATIYISLVRFLDRTCRREGDKG